MLKIDEVHQFAHFVTDFLYSLLNRDFATLHTFQVN